MCFDIYRLWKEQYGKKAKHIKASDKTAKPKYKTREKLTTNGFQKLTKESKTNKGCSSLFRINGKNCLITD